MVNRLHDDARWIVGRAGMRYRDLIPGRLGGSFIASHIHIPDAGPVPDYVHFHRVRFQMIFCAKGWVRLVYEDQGEPFVLEAGDCVLQPPRIRHRVLECSADLEVVEIGCPADHETIVEHTIELPTAALRADREFSGQRFTRHRAVAGRVAGVAPDAVSNNVTSGSTRATRGLAGARVVRPAGDPSSDQLAHDTEFQFLFVLGGTTTLETTTLETTVLDTRSTRHGPRTAGAWRRGVDPRQRPLGATRLQSRSGVARRHAPCVRDATMSR